MITLYYILLPFIRGVTAHGRSQSTAIKLVDAKGVKNIRQYCKSVHCEEYRCLPAGNRKLATVDSPRRSSS